MCVYNESVCPWLTEEITHKHLVFGFLLGTAEGDSGRGESRQDRNKNKDDFAAGNSSEPHGGNSFGRQKPATILGSIEIGRATPMRSSGPELASRVLARRIHKTSIVLDSGRGTGGAMSMSSIRQLVSR